MAPEQQNPEVGDAELEDAVGGVSKAFVPVVGEALRDAQVAAPIITPY